MIPTADWYVLLFDKRLKKRNKWAILPHAGIIWIKNDTYEDKNVRRKKVWQKIESAAVHPAVLRKAVKGAPVVDRKQVLRQI
jgi:hypothetical protein